MIFIQLDLILSMSYFNRESLESTNVPLILTVVTVKSIFVAVDGSNKLHNIFFVPATVIFSLKVGGALFVKLSVFTVVSNVLTIDNKTEGVLELSETLNAVFDVPNITSIVDKVVPS